VIRLKIVPDNDPNANGEWITMKPMSAPNLELFKNMLRRERWDLYNANAPKGYHVVKVHHCLSVRKEDDSL
jgi:hypothetical protein